MACVESMLIFWRGSCIAMKWERRFHSWLCAGAERGLYDFGGDENSRSEDGGQVGAGTEDFREDPYGGEQGGADEGVSFTDRESVLLSGGKNGCQDQLFGYGPDDRGLHTCISEWNIRGDRGNYQSIENPEGSLDGKFGR